MDYAVIGGGVIGLAIAKEIALRNLGEVSVFEKESDFGMHASGRNSGVIHSGINQRPGTLKATLCLEGNRLLKNYCIENEIPMEECGTAVVANSNIKRVELRKLYNLALEVGVPGIKIVPEPELKEIEPYAKGLEALIAPSGAIVDSRFLINALASEVERYGPIHLEAEIKTNRGRLIANENKIKSFVINCAGLHADEIAHGMGVGKRYSIIPFKGDYLEVPAQVNGMIYDVPNLRFPFLGVHLTKTTDGKVIAGPTASLSFSGREGYERTFSGRFFAETANNLHFWMWVARSAVDLQTIRQITENLRLSSKGEFIKKIKDIYDGGIEEEGIKPYRAGIRAQLVNSSGKLVNDFIVEKGPSSLHILNTVSPGLTSSLAFARYIVNKYLS